MVGLWILYEIYEKKITWEFWENLQDKSELAWQYCQIFIGKKEFVRHSRIFIDCLEVVFHYIPVQHFIERAFDMWYHRNLYTIRNGQLRWL
jgi:hypothetical protein